MRGGKIETYDNVICVECGRKIYAYDDYYAIKRNPKVGGGFVHIHISCYEKLLPKNKDRKSEMTSNNK